MKVTANFNITINSGASYLMTFIAVIGLALLLKATFNEAWIPLASLYGWHSGRRLWRQLKLPNGTEITAPEEQTK